MLPLKEAVARSLDFLAANQNAGRFGFMGIEDPGITAMALSATIRASRILVRKEPAHVKPGLDYLLSLKKKDGSVYLTGLKTYVTSVALMAFKDSGDPAYGPAAEAAAEFLVAVQSDEGEGYSMEEDPFYGGMGYGGDERPDLSNTQMALDALKAADLDERHAAFRKALRFVERCQNKAETNPTEVVLSDGRKVVAGTDGGGVYYPGNSKAGLREIDEGVFVARSYGSMTYALLKSLIFTGLDEEDKRVQAAIKWVRNNYTLDENPGFETQDDPDAGYQGLFYYYLTMARALDALGKDIITDGAGVDHDWRKELTAKILSLQRTDGSWINERSPRWFEGNPVLATSYALLVLDVCSR
jgi:squalene-hopene/tetraprenyl-beta-curcumene cyclase